MYGHTGLILGGAASVEFPEEVFGAEAAVDPSSAEALVRALLVVDPEARLGARGAEEVMAHDWWSSGPAGDFDGAEPLRCIEDWSPLEAGDEEQEGSGAEAPDFDPRLSELSQWRERQAEARLTAEQQSLFADW